MEIACVKSARSRQARTRLLACFRQPDVGAACVVLLCENIWFENFVARAPPKTSQQRVALRAALRQDEPHRRRSRCCSR